MSSNNRGENWTLYAIGGTLFLLLLVVTVRTLKSVIYPPEKTASQSAPEVEGADKEPPVLFPFSLNAPDTDGNPVDLEELQGKVVIVAIGGTWCPPCRMEIPHFIRLKNTYVDEGLEIVGVNFEKVNTEEQAIALVKRLHTAMKLNYPCVLGTREIHSQIPNLEGFPSTLILDRKGQVRFYLSGYHPYAELEKHVLPLLKLPSPSTSSPSDP